MAAMRRGTTYEQNKDGKFLVRRFHECIKCHRKVYTKNFNFQGFINREN